MTQPTVTLVGKTPDGLLSYTYQRQARYALKLPERQEEIYLPDADAVGQVLADSGRRRITKCTVFDFFNQKREKGKCLLKKLDGATIRKLNPRGQEWDNYFLAICFLAMFDCSSFSIFTNVPQADLKQRTLYIPFRSPHRIFSGNVPGAGSSLNLGVKFRVFTNVPQSDLKQRTLYILFPSLIGVHL